MGKLNLAMIAVAVLVGIVAIAPEDDLYAQLTTATTAPRSNISTAKLKQDKLPLRSAATAALLSAYTDTPSEVLARIDIGFSAKTYRSKSGAFMLSGFIENQSFEFVVDTGAYAVALSGRTAGALKNLQIKEKQKVYDSAGLSYMAEHVVIPEFSFGTIMLHDVDAFVVDDQDHPTVNLLGRSVLDRLSHWEFSKGEDALTLYQ